MIHATIPEKLKFIRKELDLSQEQLAHKLKVTFTTVNRWENNHTTPHWAANNQIHKLYLHCRRQAKKGNKGF